MGYGSSAALMAGSFLGPQSQGAAFANFVGGGFDLADSYYQNKKDQQMADASLRLQAQVAQQQLNLAAQDASDERQIRERILARAAQLDQSLLQEKAKLGPRVGVEAGDIYNNYQTLRTQIMGDYNDTVDRISSQGFADAISRGMDRSTQYTDSQSKLARIAAQELPKMEQAAFDTAIARSKGYADTLNYGRDASMKEVNDMYTSVANMEAKAMPNNVAASYANASSTANTFSNSLANRAADSQDYMGNALANFDQKVAPNVAYGLGKKGTSFVETQSADAQDLEAYRRAYGPLKG